MTASPPLLAFDITDAVTEKLEPTLEVLRDENGITVNYTFPGAAMYEDDLYPGTYRFAIPGFGVNMASAEPALLINSSNDVYSH